MQKEQIQRFQAFPSPRQSGGSKGCLWRLHFMRPFAPCFGKLVAGAQVYLLRRGSDSKDRVCDVCGHRWIPETENPPHCSSKKCRSALWNKGGVDGRTREARIKAGRSRKRATKKHR
jgi:hypothetical protein